MSKVYVVQEPPQIPHPLGQGRIPKIDLTPAERFGELVYLLGWSEGGLTAPKDLQPMLLERLQEFTADDYLLMTGSPVAMTMAACIAARKIAGKPLNMLVWYKRLGYTVVPFIP